MMGVLGFPTGSIFCGEGLQAGAEETAPEQATTKPKLRCTEQNKGASCR